MFTRKIIALIIVILLLMAGRAAAQSQPNATELLKQVAETYQKLKSYQFEVTRITETRTENIDVKSESKSEEVFSLATLKPNHSRGELKSPQYSFVTISNPSTEWLYFPRLKQYTKKAKGSAKPLTPEALASNPENMFATIFSDPFPLLAKELLMRLTEYEQLGKKTKGVKILREEPVIVRDKKIDCYVVDVDYGTIGGPLGEETARKTLWIDKTRTIALRQIAYSRTPAMFAGGSVHTTVTSNFTIAEINEPLGDALFTFDAPAGTSEVEKVSLLPPRGGLTGKEAADFKLKDISGKEFNLHGLRGKVVLLDFWATWCAPCLVELPHIEQLHREFKDKGLVVLGINAEEGEVASAFMKEKGYTFPTLVDTEGSVAELYGVEAIPQVFVIGKDGKVATHYFGTKTEIELRAALENVGFRSDPSRPSSPSIGVPVSVTPPTSGPSQDVRSQLIVRMPAAGVNIASLSAGSKAGGTLQEVQALYPPIAKAARASGPVYVMVEISDEGKVTDSSVISGHPLLRDAALAAARQWVFKPLTEGSAKVKSIAILTFTFAPTEK
jgi:TonB family protein